MIGTYKTKPVHCFSIDGKDYCVLRGRLFAAAWDKHADVVGVLAPAGMSYHQAALEAAAAMGKGLFTTAPKSILDRLKTAAGADACTEGRQENCNSREDGQQ